MSFQAMTWAIAQKPRNTMCKLVLLILANYADEDGTCFPKQQSIAEQAECSIRTVKRTLQQLREAGLLKDEKRWRKGGGQMANKYRLPLPSKSANVAPLVGARVPTTTSKSANVAPIYKDKPVTEPVTKDFSLKNGATHSETPSVRPLPQKAMVLQASLQEIIAQTAKAARIPRRGRASAA